MNRDDKLEIVLLGRLEINFKGRMLAFPTRHASFLVALLAMEGQLRRETAAARLWGERDENQARASLRQTIYHIQKVLASAGAPELYVDRQSIGLKQGTFYSDFDKFIADLKDDPIGASKAYQGELLGEVGRVDGAFQDWLDQERRALDLKFSEGITSAAEKLFADENWVGLDSVSAIRLRIDPYNEEALRHRMEALFECDKRASALALFEEFKSTLKEALDITPEPATYELRERLSNSPLESESKPEPPPAKSSESSFRERRSISLLAVCPSTIPSDPEDFAAEFSELGKLLKSALVDGSAQILDQAGATLVCVFGFTGLVERHAMAAVKTSSLLSKQAGKNAKTAIVSGDVIVTTENNAENIDLAVLAPLLSESNRLLQSAEPGQVVLSQATSIRMQPKFEHEAFVARAAELAELKDASARATKGQAQVVGIVGEAGIGKSTLLRQYLASSNTARTFTIEGYDREISRSFGAIVRFLATYVAAGETPSRAMIENAVQKKQIRAVYRETLLDLFGLANETESEHLEPEQRRLQVFKLTSEIILEATRESEVILAVEDVHWLDQDSSEFIDRLIGEISGEALTIIATFRPDHQVGWIGRSSFRLLRLAPLEDEEAEALIVPLLPNLPPKKRDRVLRQAAGNPFFLVETARVIATQSDDAQDKIPETIRDILSANFRRLAPDERRVLQCVAVLGFEAADNSISKLSGFDETRLDRALATLRREELLVRTRVGSVSRHRFRHAMLHNAAQSAIPKAEAKLLHAKAYDHFRDHSEIDPLVIALHAWNSESWELAASWYLRAGDQFTSLSSYALAAKAYQKSVVALERTQKLTDTKQRRLQLALKLRPVLVPIGHYEKAQEELNVAKNIAEQMTDRTSQASVQISKSYLFSTHGYFEDAIACARNAAALCEPAEQITFEAKLAEAQALSLMGAWQETISLLAPTIPYWEENRAERFGHTGTRSIWCHGHLSNASALNGQVEAARKHAERAFDLANETKRPIDMIFALHRLGRVELFSNRPEEAHALLLNGLRRAEEIDVPIFASWLAGDVTSLLLATGRTDEANRILNEHINTTERLNLRQFNGWLRLNRVEHLRNENRISEAKAEAEAVLLFAKEINDLALEPAAMRALGNFSEGDERGSQIAQATNLAKKRGLSFFL